MQPFAPHSVDHNPAGVTDATVIEALQGRTGTRRFSFRYELLNDENAKIGDLDNVLEGVVEQNWLADIKRKATFQLEEVGYINYLTDRIKPWARLHLPPYGATDWVEWPLGVFLLSTPTRRADPDGRVLRSVDGYDQLQVYADDKLVDRQGCLGGLYVTDVIAGLLGPTVQKNMTPSTDLVPVTKEWPPGTSKLKMINELLSTINYESLSFDEDGVAQVVPYRSPQDRPAEYTYADDDTSLIIPNVDQTLDLFSIPNRWVLAVSEPDRDPIVGVYTNNDPGSLTSTIRRGRTITDFRQEIDVVNQETLDAKARRLGIEASQVFEAIDFQTGLMPVHSGNDVYWIVFQPLAIAAQYAEHSWTLPLKAGDTMTHRARRVVVLNA